MDRILEIGLVSPDQPFALFFAFVIAHMLGDYPLQGEFLAIGKNHRLPKDARTGAFAPKCLWMHCLAAHSVIQGGLVWLVSGSLILGVAETVLHVIIDFVKSEGITNFHVDQFLHLLCKVVWVFLLVQGIVS